MSAVNKRLISGVAGQRAMFASKPSRTEAAPRAVSFRQRPRSHGQLPTVSNSVRPHRWQPTRLPRPWDSPGKNTGVGCHFLLQCMKVKSESEVAQSCPTLRDPMDCSLTGSSVHGIFQARVLEWGAITFLQRTVSMEHFKIVV